MEIFDLNELPNVVSRFINSLKNKRIFAFYGKMGAGKTTFIKQLCLELGVKDMVTSPTFAIINEYSTFSKLKIFHIDCYRLNSINEALNLGIEDYIYSENFCFIEWAEMIENLLPAETVFVQISETETGKRKILWK